MRVLGQFGVFGLRARAGRRRDVVETDVEVQVERAVQPDLDVDRAVGDGDLALDAGETGPLVGDVDVRALGRVQQVRPRLEHVLDTEPLAVPVAPGLVAGGVFPVADRREDARGDVRVLASPDEDGRRGRAEQGVALDHLVEPFLDPLEVVGDGVGLLLGELSLERLRAAVQPVHELVQAHQLATRAWDRQPLESFDGGDPTPVSWLVEVRAATANLWAQAAFS